MDPEMGWAGRLGPAGLGPFWPISWPPSSVMLPVSSRSFSLLHVGPWSQFLLCLDEAPIPARFNIFCSGSRSFPSSQVGPWASWSHVHIIAWVVPGFKVLSRGAWLNLFGSLAFNAKFLHKHQTPKPTCTNELVIPRGLVAMDKTTPKVNSWLGWWKFTVNTC
jgi:hypothetical protein